MAFATWACNVFAVSWCWQALSVSLSLNRSLSLRDRDRSDTIIAQPHLGWLSCKWFVINIIRFNKFSQRESLLRPIFTYRSLLLTFPNVFDKILTPALHPETLKNESFFFFIKLLLPFLESDFYCLKILIFLVFEIFSGQLFP